MRTGRGRSASTAAAFPPRRRANVPEVERRRAERLVASNRSIARPSSRDEQLPGRDVDRAGRLQREDGVEAARGEVAERERGQPMIRSRLARSPTIATACSATREVSVASKASSSIVSVGRSSSSGSPFRKAPRPPRGRTVLAVSRSRARSRGRHRPSSGRPPGDREREEGDAALRVQRAVDRVDDDGGGLSPAGEPSSSETSERRRPRLERARTTRPRPRGVDRGRVVAALAGADDRLAVGRRGRSRARRRTSATAARLRRHEVGDDASRRSRHQLRGEEVGQLLQHDLAAPGGLEDVLDPRRPEQERGVRVAAINRATTASSRMPPCRRRPAARARRRGRRRGARRPRAARSARRGRGRRRAGRRLGSSIRHAAGAVHVLGRGGASEDRQALLAGRDEHASSQAVASVPSSSWKASAVS